MQMVVNLENSDVVYVVWRGSVELVLSFAVTRDSLGQVSAVDSYSPLAMNLPALR